MGFYINFFTNQKKRSAVRYPKGTMTKDANHIFRVSVNKKYAPRGIGSAIRWLTYYLNRGGKGIKPQQRKEIEKARRMLQRKLSKTPVKKTRKKSKRRSPLKRRSSLRRNQKRKSPRR